ncbi:hypothetical protein CTI12_AA216680 [Artemisia annua]|uniref:Uncharacterized protein n=1 Tax=Artemisia annua TaxID=35608 RepID=A0A2U1NY26_ARTAN|nr:hypothetical protein CTI12_AA216680 [Artemisia annua]
MNKMLFAISSVGDEVVVKQFGEARVVVMQRQRIKMMNKQSQVINLRVRVLQRPLMEKEVVGAVVEEEDEGSSKDSNKKDDAEALFEHSYTTSVQNLRLFGYKIGANGEVGNDEYDHETPNIKITEAAEKVSLLE